MSADHLSDEPHRPEADTIQIILNGAITDASNTFLYYGRKQLRLSLDATKNFRTYLATVGGEKHDNETTLLYKAARALMQKRADETGSVHHYFLTTIDPSMLAWAHDASKGCAIFRWKNISKEPSADGVLYDSFEAEIAPAQDAKTKRR